MELGELLNLFISSVVRGTFFKPNAKQKVHIRVCVHLVCTVTMNNYKTHVSMQCSTSAINWTRGNIFVCIIPVNRT